MAYWPNGDILKEVTEKMQKGSHAKDVERALELVTERRRREGRTIIGIAGPPAAGKSTLAASVVRALNERAEGPVPCAALLPMDGYHLDNRVLDLRGLRARKGAPETFDAHGFCDAVRDLASARREVFLPLFDRKLDLAIANAIPVRPETPIVVAEGNYLLLKSDPWASLREVFDATISIFPPLEELRERLMARWAEYGLDPETAGGRVTGNDLPNARLIMDDSFGADLRLSV